MKNRKLKGALWLILYPLMVFLPILLLIIFPHSEQRGFLREVAVGVGFIGMALMGLQFIPTARLRILTRSFSLEKLYDYHHKLSILAGIMILLHPILLLLDGVPLGIFNIFVGTWRSRAGILSLIAVIFLIISSIFRKQLKMKYDVWRYMHNFNTLIAVGLGLLHMFLVNHHLSLPYQKVLWIVLPAIWVAIILYVRIVKPAIMLKRPYKVVSLEKERNSTWSLNVKPVGHQGMAFSAGQFAWISRESPFLFHENPFSFSTNADVKDGSFGFTIKDLGDFTSTIKNFKPGDQIYIDGPYGNFAIDQFKHKNLVFVAGGIGSAPVMSMLRTMASRNDQTQVIFFYGSPDWDSIIYREELEDLDKKINLTTIHVLENKHEGWDGEIGYLTLPILKKYLPEDYKSCIYFMCGPLPMLDAMEGCLDELEVPAKNIHSEKYDLA